MQKDVLINIIGTQNNGTEEDRVELMTHGRLYEKHGKYYLCYEDSEATGFAGCRTVVKIEGNDRVTMTRKSEKARSELVIELGRRHLCHYDTGFGDLFIGISGNQIDTKSLNMNGGTVKFSYTLDVNTGFESKNSVTIEVKDPSVQQ